MSASEEHDSILIVGCGDIGLRVADLWLERNKNVTGLVRNIKQVELLNARGIQSVSADLNNVDSLTAISTDSKLVYYFAPPPAVGVADTCMANFISAINGQKANRIIYISTSGVYGNTNGNWVSEDDIPDPQTDRGKRRLDAEKRVQAYCENAGIACVVLRVPGIYGPRRLPIDRIKQGRPVVKDHTAFTNRIHEDDLARICVRAGEFAKPPGIYNISDGYPGSMAQYFTEIASVLGLPLPPEISWKEAQSKLSPDMLSYLSESRRISNQKMLKELGVSLLYPDFKKGLQACVEALGDAE